MSDAERASSSIDGIPPIQFGLFRNLDDEGWALIFDPVKRTEFIGFMTLNLAYSTSFRSRIIEIAGEPQFGPSVATSNVYIPIETR